MTIRTATMNDLDVITAVETECFPAAEAASREEFSKRLTYYKAVSYTHLLSYLI